MADNSSNPGKVMAAAVDMEIAAFQKLQSELQQYRADQQVLLSQHNENEMVKQVSFYLQKRTFHSAVPFRRVEEKHTPNILGYEILGGDSWLIIHSILLHFAF